MLKQIRVVIIGAIVSCPAIACAETKTLKTVLFVIVDYFRDILALIMGFAVVMFVWNVVRYFMRPTDKRAEGALYVMWSVAGFFIIFSMWGIVTVLMNTFNLDQNSPTSLNQIHRLFPTDGGSVSSGSSPFNQGLPAQPVQNTQSSGNTSSSQNSPVTSGNSAPQSNPFSSREVRTADAAALRRYDINMNSGVYTGDNQTEIARSIDLATKSGVPVYEDSKIEFSSTGGVPTSISVDGKNVPIDQNQYTPAELRSIKAAQSIRNSSGQ